MTTKTVSKGSVRTRGRSAVQTDSRRAEGQAATLAHTLLEKLRASWKRPDLSIDVQPSDDGFVLCITPVHMPGDYTYIVQRHLWAPLLRELERSDDLDDLVTEILFDIDSLPAVGDV